jgi:hypothetical protein
MSLACRLGVGSRIACPIRRASRSRNRPSASNPLTSPMCLCFTNLTSFCAKDRAQAIFLLGKTNQLQRLSKHVLLKTVFPPFETQQKRAQHFFVAATAARRLRQDVAEASDVSSGRWRYRSGFLTPDGGRLEALEVPARHRRRRRHVLHHCEQVKRNNFNCNPRLSP